MTADDRIKCDFAIDAACLWPLSLVPPRNKKHLVPHLFSWTQNLLAMTFVLRMCQKSDYLSDICKEGGIREADIESAISSMLQWLEDVRQVDGIADWSIRVLGPALSIWCWINQRLSHSFDSMKQPLEITYMHSGILGCADPKVFNPVLVDCIQTPIQMRFCGVPE